MEQSIQGRAAIVTGAGNGLGLAIARRFGASGSRVLLVDRDPIVETRLGEDGLPKGQCFSIVQDLARKEAAQVVFARALEMMSRVDTLINNAAWSMHKPLLETTNEVFDEVVAINQRAPFFLAQEFFRYISQAVEKPNDPAIINISSVNAQAGNANLIAYAGTKGALEAMTRAMAVEMAPFGIRVNSISPGVVDTPATRRAWAESMLDRRTQLESFLIKRVTPSEEIAELVAYLCTPACGCVTGANWVIDGGYLAR